MTPETFVEKFDKFVDAPHAIVKMRELVLQSAIEGKLVEHCDEDGDVSDLFLAISQERKDAAPKMRTPLEPDASDDDLDPFQIPTTWGWTRLGNLALQIQYGYTASADLNATEIRMLRITDIQNSRVDWPAVPGCDIQPGEAEKYLLAPNDILIARTGGTIGKSFIVPDAPVKSVFASYLIRVTPPRSMVARYLKTVLESPLYWKQLRAMSAGTGQPNINGRALGRLAIPVPPLAEQKRIVAKVDELMALCDRLEAQQEERETRQTELARASLARFADTPTPPNLNFLFHKSYDIAPGDLRKSILTSAFQGDLVEDADHGEIEAGAEEVLSRAASARRRWWEERYQSKRRCPEPEAHKSKGLPRIPAHWVWASIDSVCAQVTDGEHIQPPYQTEGFPMLSAKHVRDGHVTLEGAGLISKEAFEKSMERCEPVNGDILIVSVGATTGRSAIIDDCPRFAIVRSVLLLKPVIPKEYLHWWLKHPWAFTWMTQASGASAQPHLYIRDLKRMPIPIPPLSEQHRIVDCLNWLMAIVDQLETQLSTSREVGAHLLDAIIAELVA